MIFMTITVPCSRNVTEIDKIQDHVILYDICTQDWEIRVFPFSRNAFLCTHARLGKVIKSEVFI